jgi:hypothetical protein
MTGWVRAKGRGVTRQMRQLVVAACSLAVVTSMALYVLAPASVAYSFSESRRPAHAGTVVVYGRAVDRKAVGVAGVEFVLSRQRRHSAVVVARFDSGADGTYRFSAILPEDRYVLVVTVSSTDDPRHHQRRFEIEPGNAYRISIRVLHRRDGFVFLPITSY